MMPIKRFFAFYVHGSFHVALMVVCFYQISIFQWQLTAGSTRYGLVFLLSYLAYNFIKNYASFNSLRKLKSSPIVFLFFTSLFLVILILSYSLTLAEKLLLILSGCLSFFYVIPFPKRKKTLRTSFGLKIFIVALCWTLITAVFPLLSSGLALQWYHVLFFVERFLLVLVATLPFEIQDLNTDKELGTIPQLIGVRNTQWLGGVLLLIIAFLIGINPKLQPWGMGVFVGMGVAYFFALFGVIRTKSNYFTLFWVEGIPFLGLSIYHLKNII